MGKPLFGSYVLRRLLQLPGNLYQWRRLPKIEVGDVYLDCGNHPVVCTEVTLVSTSSLGPWDYDLAGVSLLDGSSPRSCSVRHCAPRKVTLDTAILWLATADKREHVLEHINQIVASSPELHRVWS